MKLWLPSQDAQREPTWNDFKKLAKKLKKHFWRPGKQHVAPRNSNDRPSESDTDTTNL
jgi:hypothetical protein